MRKFFALTAVLFATSACHTINGVGQDLSDAGNSVAGLFGYSTKSTSASSSSSMGTNIYTPQPMMSPQPSAAQMAYPPQQQPPAYMQQQPTPQANYGGGNHYDPNYGGNGYNSAPPMAAGAYGGGGYNSMPPAQSSPYYPPRYQQQMQPPALPYYYNEGY